MVRESYVNIVDLVERLERRSGFVTRFESLNKLAQYTIATDKVYPKRTAYAKPLLRYLLREILNKYDGERGQALWKDRERYERRPGKKECSRDDKKDSRIR